MDRLSLLLRGAAIACTIAILTLSLLPAQDLRRTGAPHGVEHAVAYLGTSLIYLMALRPRRLAAGLPPVLSLCALAVAMEIAQQFVPGRGAHFSDFAMSALGALLALPTYMLVRRMAPRLAA